MDGKMILKLILACVICIGGITAIVLLFQALFKGR